MDGEPVRESVYLHRCDQKHVPWLEEAALTTVPETDFLDGDLGSMHIYHWINITVQNHNLGKIGGRASTGCFRKRLVNVDDGRHFVGCVVITRSVFIGVLCTKSHKQGISHWNEKHQQMLRHGTCG